MRAADEVPVERLDVSLFRVPTDGPEADGTLRWDHTDVVVVELHGGGRRGTGFSYASRATAQVVDDPLRGVVLGANALDVKRIWLDMNRAVRNIGRPGIASMAISAVETALWDLKARLLDLPLPRLLGMARDSVELYGSGGFTNYDPARLREQLLAWVEEGFRSVKMKIGANVSESLSRIRVVREAIGPTPRLFIDANGCFDRKQALDLAWKAAEWGVSWLEEPVSSDDLEGLRLIRDRSPPGLRIAAGEYGYTNADFMGLLQGRAVDVLQADITRCGGFIPFLQAATLAQAFSLPFSAHTSPSLHAIACCAAPAVMNVEWFYDHVRIEGMFFEGAPQPKDGWLAPDLTRPGHGLELKRVDVERYRI